MKFMAKVKEQTTMKTRIFFESVLNREFTITTIITITPMMMPLE